MTGYTTREEREAVQDLEDWKLGRTDRYNSRHVMNALRAMVEERGEDFVYQSAHCSYARDGQPSCGVGYVLHHTFGVTIADLVKLDDGDEVSGSSSVDALRDLFFDNMFTSCATDILQVFQFEQDDHVRYGQILEFLEKKYGV